MEQATRRKLAAGGTLVVLGLGLYWLQFLAAGQRPVVLILIGVGLLAAYFATRSSFALVVGCIVGGLGIGLFGEPRWLVLHEFTEIGLGLGFALIYLIRLAYERRSHWWPLVPALVLFLLGFQAWREFRRFVFSARGWPFLLVILGVLIALGALGRGRRGRQSA